MTISIATNKRTVQEIRANLNTTSASKTSSASNSKSSVSKTDDSQEVASNQSSTELKEELEALQKEKELNLKKMELIEEQIEELAQEAEDNIIEAAKKQEKAIAEHEDDAKEALDKEIKKYIEANKDGGDGMSKSQLQTNIKNSMPNAEHLAAALAKLTEANEQIAQIDSLLGSLNMLISDVRLIDTDISSKTSQYDSAVKSEQAKSCDPIGFTVDGEDGDVRYDFIVDDGSFDTTDDFLGSSGQWAEMQALDTSGDGIVSAQELSDNNIKAVRTNPDGTRDIVDITEEFGSDFSIDLNSYKTGGSHSSVNTMSDSDGDGTKDQQLLGTFSVNVGDKSIKGYNTLDDVDYLQEEYGVSAGSETDIETSEELSSHVNFFSEYSSVNADLKEKLITGYESLDVSEEFINLINKESQTEGAKQANIFMEKLNEEMEAQRAQEEKEAQEAKELEEEDEIQEADEEDTIEDDVDNTNKTNSSHKSDSGFQEKDITRFSDITEMRQYINSIEKALEKGDQKAVEALHGITSENIQQIVENSKAHINENGTSVSTQGIQNVADGLKEQLENLKSEFPQGYQFPPDINW